jgi:sulfate adenylyltransferase large subunit
MSPEPGIVLQDNFALFLQQNLDKELLRFTTAGSVDDGKSTLIGRLLHDSKSVYEDQLASVKSSTVNRSTGPVDFSLLTDGLRAEREQGITIDVGYRYFTTARRKFIIADTPGHEQYTRNMATGASTADLAVILVDGKRGLLPQTTRHAYIASLLAIPRIIVAINKMDLVGYREERFSALKKDFLALAERVGLGDVQCIPVSALTGDNVVERSALMPWYEGPTLLEHLETVPISKPIIPEGGRFPVQYVIRPGANFRGFAGQVSGGVIRPGDAVTALPSLAQSRVESIVTYDGRLAEAFSPMSVTLTLEDEIDLSRGDMLVASDNLPHVSHRFAASIVWMQAQPLETDRSYLIKQTTRQVPGRVAKIRHRLNINTLEPEAAGRLDINDIAVAELETTRPLFFDFYDRNRTTGSFIFIDPLTNETLGAGMIREDLSESHETRPSRGTTDPTAPVSSLERHRRQGHFPAVILVNTNPRLVAQIERTLFEDGFQVMTVVGESESLILRRGAWSALHAAGFVVLYQNSATDSEERSELKEIAGDRFFDLRELALPVGDAKVVAHVHALAKTLRLGLEDENSREGN